MLNLVRKIVKQTYLSIPKKLFILLVIGIVIILPLVVLWFSLEHLSEGLLLVGIILLIIAIGAFIESIAILISLDDLFIELEKKKRRREE